MAIYLSRKKGGTVATPITPSNATPAALTADTPINPTANGYAIESYTTVAPSNPYPDALTDGEIYKANGNGYFVVDKPYDITPNNTTPEHLGTGNVYRSKANGWAIASYSSKTPNDTTPPTVSSGDIVKMGGAGYLYATQQTTPTSITPSNSSPVALTANTPVNPTASGYAISSYSSKTPSDSSPASVSSGAIIKASASGYLYASSGLVNMVNITNTASKDTNFTLSSGNTTTISVTSKPRLILWFQGNYGSGISAGYGEMGMYDGINNRYRRVTFYSGGANTATDGGDISSVSSSTISFKNNGTTSRRYHVMMWY